MYDVTAPMADAGVPKFTTAQMPDMILTAQAVSGQGTAPSQPPALTPQSLNERLPSIVQPAPVTVPPPCDSFAQWVNDHQLLIGIGMALTAFFVWHGRGGK